MRFNNAMGCHRCFFWGASSTPENADEIKGPCHRLPPIWSSYDQSVSFPTTLGNVVCGEFVDKRDYTDIFARKVVDV